MKERDGVMCCNGENTIYDNLENHFLKEINTFEGQDACN